MKLFRTALLCSLAAVIAAPTIAADKKKSDKKATAAKKSDKKKSDKKATAKKGQKRPARTPQVVRLPKQIQLSEEQQGQLKKINAEYAPKLGELMKKFNSIVTPEQRKAQREALTAARKDGKKGKELRDAVNAAVKISDDQLEQRKTIGKELAALRKQAQEKAVSILTEEQKAQLKRPARKKSPKKAAAKKKDN